MPSRMDLRSLLVIYPVGLVAAVLLTPAVVDRRASVSAPAGARALRPAW
jgi:hypothetical protein